MVFNIINAFTAPLHGCKKDMDCDSRAKCNDGKCICQGNTTGNGKFCRGNSPWKDWVLAFSSTYCNILLSSCTWSPALLSYNWLLLLPSDSHQTNMAQHCYLNFPRKLNWKALSTPMRFQKCAFSLSSKTHGSILAHTTVWCVFDNLACEQALHLGDIVKSTRARGTREETPLAASPFARAFSRGSLRSPK